MKRTLILLSLSMLTTFSVGADAVTQKKSEVKKDVAKKAVKQVAKSSKGVVLAPEEAPIVFIPKKAKVIKGSGASCRADKVFVEKDVNLMWQDKRYMDSEVGAYKRNYSAGKAGNHGHAVSYCRSLNYAGYMDWRLPTSDELSYIHEKEGSKFSYLADGDYWTSTPTAENRYNVVFPVDAMRYARAVSESNYIRCVRCIGSEYYSPGSKIIR